MTILSLRVRRMLALPAGFYRPLVPWRHLEGNIIQIEDFGHRLLMKVRSWSMKID
jgi:hypothetical protein